MRGCATWSFRSDYAMTSSWVELVSIVLETVFIISGWFIMRESWILTVCGCNSSPVKTSCLFEICFDGLLCFWTDQRLRCNCCHIIYFVKYTNYFRVFHLLYLKAWFLVYSFVPSCKIIYIVVLSVCKIMQWSFISVFIIRTSCYSLLARYLAVGLQC